jgi:short-subunit dehydrogenase
MDIAGSRVLLTGASGGLGQAIAKGLHERGAHLLLTARREEVLEELVSELGERAEAFSADMCSHDDVAALPERVGRVDILVANAGLPGSGRVESFSPGELDRVIDVNLRAPVQLTRALMPGMVERGAGHLVYVSSMAGKIPTVRASIYSATKYGLRGFAGAIRDDLKGTGVGVSAIFPGPISEAGMWGDTGIQTPKGVPKRYPGDVAAAVIKGIETNRPEIDVADPIQKFGAITASVAPRLGARIRSLKFIGLEKIADETAEKQRDKR